VVSSIHYNNQKLDQSFVKPTVHRLFRTDNNNSDTKHQKFVKHSLKILALNGSLTTWEMAKFVIPNNLDRMQSKEKKYRRLFVGRVDRGKYLPGLLDQGLVIQEEKLYKNRQTVSYKLSLHGILYCLGVIDLTNEEIDIMASKYVTSLPRVFGKWLELKAITDDIYKIRTLSKGIVLDDTELVKHKVSPIYELVTYLNLQYKKNDYITEYDLAEKISYWFYVYFLYVSKSKNKTNSIIKIKTVLESDDDLKQWFLEFIYNSRQHYMQLAKNLTVLVDHL